MTQLNKPGEEFIALVRKMWIAEKMLIEAIPQMIERSNHLGLQKTIALHLAETTQHKEVLAAIAKQLDFSLENSENSEMEFILQQGRQDMEAGDGDINVAIIRSAIQVEQYEMKKYEELAQHAGRLGYEGIQKRLMLTYEEERQANTKLHYFFKILESDTADIGELTL